VGIDEKALRSLIEESDDLQSDAMRTTKAGLAEVVEQGQDRRAAGGFDVEETRAYQINRRRLLAKSLTGMGALAGTAMGAGILDMFTSPAFADTPMDIQAGQTAASIENLAIAVYTKAAGLPFMQNIPSPAGPTVVAFVTKTIAQHKEHLAAFNSAVTNLGGKAQTAALAFTLPALNSPSDVVALAAKLEGIAAETYAAETAAVSDKMLRSAFATIMGVEAQHQAILLAVGALLKANKANLVAIPPSPLSDLPGAAGSVGFPNSFIQNTDAVAATAGVVK
jgi:hypothetical protein